MPTSYNDYYFCFVIRGWWLDSTCRLQMNFKILRPFTGTGAVFFPIGLPPKGTCEFASSDCLNHCYTIEESYFEEETNIANEELWYIYNYFMEQPINKICDEIVKELDGLQTPILHWFGMGDCRTKDVDRMSKIINAIPNNIIQMGFTRNIKLWEKYKNIFALTVESMKETKNKEGLFSIPNYDEGISIIYSSKYTVRGGYCGPVTCKDFVDSKLEHFINCRVCYKLSTGCFDRRKFARVAQW